MKREELILAGMDVDDFLMRLMNNENLVRMFVEKFLADQTYDTLVKAIERGNAKEAESACHTLKGVCGNLSLMELFQELQAQLKDFRAGQFGKGVGHMEKITSLYDKAVYHMKQWLQD